MEVPIDSLQSQEPEEGRFPLRLSRELDATSTRTVKSAP
jgi:hypothetical protein